MNLKMKKTGILAIFCLKDSIENHLTLKSDCFHIKPAKYIKLNKFCTLKPSWGQINGTNTWKMGHFQFCKFKLNAPIPQSDQKCRYRHQRSDWFLYLCTRVVIKCHFCLALYVFSAWKIAKCYPYPYKNYIKSSKIPFIFKLVWSIKVVFRLFDSTYEILS